jgi:hypothetical protein
MTKSRTYPAPVPDCTGQAGGHLPVSPGALVVITDAYRGPVPGFPRVEVRALPALAGNPCVGVLTRLEDEAGRALPALHAAELCLTPHPPLTAAPHLTLCVTRSDTGRLCERWAGVPDGLPPHVQAYLFDAWRWIERHRLGGRRLGSHTDGWEIVAAEAIAYLMDGQAEIRHARPRSQLYVWAELQGLKRATIRAYIRDYDPAFWAEYERYH